jgi:hypothetical protein
MDDLEVIHGRLVDLIEISKEHREAVENERDDELDGLQTLNTASYMSASQGAGTNMTPIGPNGECRCSHREWCIENII